MTCSICFLRAGNRMVSSVIEHIEILAAGTYPQDKIRVQIKYNGQWFTGWLSAVSGL